jgi:hypothetical protein
MSDAAVAHMQQFDWDHVAVEWQRLFEVVTDKKRARSAQNFVDDNSSCIGTGSQQPGTPASDGVFSAKWREGLAPSISPEKGMLADEKAPEEQKVLNAAGM